MIADFYTLTVESVCELDRVGEKTAVKVLNNLNKASENITIPKFIAGFDLDGVGRRTIQKIVDAGFYTLEKIRGASIEDLAQVELIGDIKAEMIHNGVNNAWQQMKDVLKSPKVSLIELKSAETISGGLSGMSFCFTGKLETMTRNEAGEKVKKLGAIVKSGVSKGLTYLVTNTPNSNSSKNVKARKIGTQVIDEMEFLKII